MTARHFSKKQAIQYGWNTTKKNLSFLVGITFLVGLIQFAPNLLEPHLREQDTLRGLINIVLYIISLGVTLGSIKIYLKIVDNKKPEFSDLFSLFKAKLILRYFASSFLYGLAVVLGLFLLVVPGVYIAIKYLFFNFFIVDKELGIVEAFAKSGEITKGRIWNLFQLEVLLWLIMLAGLIAFFIGLLVALPVISLTMAYVYRHLSPAAHHKSS